MTEKPAIITSMNEQDAIPKLAAIEVAELMRRHDADEFAEIQIRLTKRNGKYSEIESQSKTRKHRLRDLTDDKKSEQ